MKSLKTIVLLIERHKLSCQWKHTKVAVKAKTKTHQNLTVSDEMKASFFVLASFSFRFHFHV